MQNVRELARFIRELQFSDLPDVVVEKAKETTLDSWGVQLATSTLPWSKMVYRYGRAMGGAPQASVINYGLQTHVANAAFINGCFGHGFEMDYNHPGTGLKGGALVVPTALAVSEFRVCSGKEFITALVGGFQVMAKIALADWDAHDLKAAGVTGAIGPAMVTAKLMGFDEETTMQTLLAAVAFGGERSGAVGPRPAGAPPEDRGFLKRVGKGKAVLAGVQAAMLAQEGMTARQTDIAFADGFDGLSSDWELLKTHYKIYAQDGHIQPVSEALERLQSSHVFKVEEIERVRVGTHGIGIGVIDGQDEPKTLLDAQFSVTFSVALFLAKGGAGFREYTECDLGDPELLELAQRVVIEVDDDIAEIFKQTHARCAKVTIRMKSGEEFTETVDHLRIMNSEEVDNKFRRLSTVVLDQQRSEQLLATVRGLEDLRDISTLRPLLIR